MRDNEILLKLSRTHLDRALQKNRVNGVLIAAADETHKIRA